MNRILKLFFKKAYDLGYQDGIKNGWYNCENADIYTERARAYEAAGNAEEAAWQRQQSETIRKKYEPAYG
jgi:hypothetical protein